MKDPNSTPALTKSELFDIKRKARGNDYGAPKAEVVPEQAPAVDEVPAPDGPLVWQGGDIQPLYEDPDKLAQRIAKAVGAGIAHHALDNVSEEPAPASRAQLHHEQ